MAPGHPVSMHFVAEVAGPVTSVKFPDNITFFNDRYAVRVYFDRATGD